MPDAIGHYKILESLGSGAIGEVYRARDTRLGRTVALKVLSPAVVADPVKFDALSNVAARLAKLSHPNIAMLFDGGQEGDRYYLVFEFVQGQPLGSLINGRPLQVRTAVEFAINLADALAEAHAADLIHGDIRPDTIMITPKDRAKFMNFGLAPFTGGGMNRVNASSAYVSPEELAGRPADARSDIYSLGAVMFEMLTGRQRARGLVLKGLNPAVPAEIEQIMSRMLAATVEHRARSAATIAAELRSVAAILDTRTEAAEAAEAAAAVKPLRRARRRGRGVPVMIMLLLMAALAAVAWYFLQGA
jgi:eukaryotic-like serine/threonine-protein kinase